MQKHTIKVLFAILMLTSLSIVILPTSIAQSKPSVPEFTVKLVDNSYNVPPTQTIDPYKGTTTQPGYHVDKKEIEITIKNQNLKVMYNVRTKGHIEQEWQERFYAPPGNSRYPEQSNGQYTVITLHTSMYPDGAQVDVQVEAMIGTISWIHDPTAFMADDGSRGGYHFEGEKSGWSKTQTIKIALSTFTPAPSLPSNTAQANPDPSTPNQSGTKDTTIFGLTLWVGAVLVVLFSIIVVLLVIIVVGIYMKKSPLIRSMDT